MRNEVNVELGHDMVDYLLIITPCSAQDFRSGGSGTTALIKERGLFKIEIEVEQTARQSSTVTNQTQESII